MESGGLRFLNRSQQRERRIECRSLFPLCSPVQNRAPITATKNSDVASGSKAADRCGFSALDSSPSARKSRRPSSELRLQQHVQSLKRVEPDSSNGGLFVPPVRVLHIDHHQFRRGLTGSQQQRTSQLAAMLMWHRRPLLFRSIHSTARHPAALPIFRPAAARPRRRTVSGNRTVTDSRRHKRRRQHSHTQTENQPGHDQRSNCAGGVETSQTLYAGLPSRTR